MSKKPVVLVSGFGPFGNHPVNASWESVKKISKTELEEKFNIDIVTVEIPVVYEEVDKSIPLLWKKYQPILFIHVGVSGEADRLTLETMACSNGYFRRDCDGRLPCNGLNCCPKADPDVCKKIRCGIDVGEICESINAKMNDVKACISTNAGRYLCEYTYFTSLAINPMKTLFVHVPDINKPYSTSQTAKGLDMILELCLAQLQKCVE